jgi:hypothetical protein
MYGTFRLPNGPWNIKNICYATSLKCARKYTGHFFYHLPDMKLKMYRAFFPPLIRNVPLNAGKVLKYPLKCTGLFFPPLVRKVPTVVILYTPLLLCMSFIHVNSWTVCRCYAKIMPPQWCPFLLQVQVREICLEHTTWKRSRLYNNWYSSED